MSQRSWVFTLNNPTVEETITLENCTCRYLIYGLEVGENNTPHYQGYIEFGKVMRLSACKKLLTRAHWEIRCGTREQARQYSMKDGDYIELGEWELGGQGTRNDLHDMIKLIKKNTPQLEILETLPEVVSRNMRFMEKYTALHEKETTKNFREVEVHVLWGDAGTGKTRKVFEECPDVFTVNSDEAFPFEGYSGETELLIDDFYGGIKYHNLLRILDGYQYRVNIKGSHRYAKWQKIYITSNDKPENWYSRGLTNALARRLTSVTEYRNNEAGNTMPPQVGGSGTPVLLEQH